jgi:hypothetical protein
MNFFISRAGEDRDCAKWISSVLVAEGHTTTLQDDDFKSGSFVEHMQLAMERADRMIVVLSPHYLAKDFTLRELRSAIADKRPIIPVRVAACELPHPIKDLICVEFEGKDEAQRKRALLDAIGNQIRTSNTEAPHDRPSPLRPRRPTRAARTVLVKKANRFPPDHRPRRRGQNRPHDPLPPRPPAGPTVFGWSFYSQGTHEKSQTSSDRFFAEALRWFGITVPATESIFNKVDRLVDALRHERVLLILDGIEPLQEPEGGLRDLALKALLQELAARNAGLALTQLGTYLVPFCDGEIGRRTDIRALQVDETKPGRHARKVMASYARMYCGR